MTGAALYGLLLSGLLAAAFVIGCHVESRQTAARERRRGRRG